MACGTATALNALDEAEDSDSTEYQRRTISSTAHPDWADEGDGEAANRAAIDAILLFHRLRCRGAIISDSPSSATPMFSSQTVDGSGTLANCRLSSANPWVSPELNVTCTRSNAMVL